MAALMLALLLSWQTTATHAQAHHIDSPAIPGHRSGWGNIGAAVAQREQGGKAAAEFLAKLKSKGLGSAAENPPLSEDSIYGIQLEKGRELRYGTPGSAALDDAAALKLFEEVAYAPKAGFEKAMALYEAALVYATGGKGVEQDMTKAVHRLSESARLKYAEAKHTLAFFLSTGFGGKPSDDKSALTFEEPAAEGGAIGANLAMGFRYMFGAGVELNCSAALENYKAVADIAVAKGNHYPDLLLRKDQHLISLLESRQKNGKSDSALRAQWLKEAAGGKNAEALFEVGKMYDTGSYGMEQDAFQAFDFFLAAAEKGHAGAMSQVALVYAMAGREEREKQAGSPEGAEAATFMPSLAQDLDTAIDWFEKAGALGDPIALNALAYMYMNGKGVDMDLGKAQELYHTAAEAGHPEALLYMGQRLLEEGETQEGLANLHMSEDQGNIFAAYHLGQVYEVGVDEFEFPPSCETAAEMYKKAAEGGYWIAGVRYGIDLYRAGQYTQAITILSMLAEEGYEIAQANAAYMFEHRMGYSFPDADDQALRLYERASVQSPDHFFALGNLMLKMEQEGKSTTANAGPVTGVGQAMSYLETAAELGNAQALRKLAEMYEVGMEGVVVKNTQRALSLYKRLLTVAGGEKGSGRIGWSSLVDITNLQWKVTSLSARTGFSSVMGGGGEGEGRGKEERRTGLEGIRASAAEGL
eukprot:evm.model.NODE_16750_length_12696_cov_35.850582.4